MQNSTRCDRQQHHGWHYRNISKEIFPEYLDHGDLGTPGTKSNDFSLKSLSVHCTKAASASFLAHRSQLDTNRLTFSRTGMQILI